MHWHLDPALGIADPARRRACTSPHVSGARARLAIPGLDLRILRGDRPGDPGSVSPVYGRFVPSHVIEATTRATAPLWIVSALDLLEPGEEAGAVRVQAVAQSGGSVPLAVFAGRGGSTDITLCRGRSARHAATVSIDRGLGRALTTDARVAHARVDHEGRLVRLCLVEATAFRYEGEAPVTFAASEPVQHLAALFADRRAPLVEASVPRRAFTLDADLQASRPRGGRAHHDGRQAPSAPTR